MILFWKFLYAFVAKDTILRRAKGIVFVCCQCNEFIEFLDANWIVDIRSSSIVFVNKFSFGNYVLYSIRNLLPYLAYQSQGYHNLGLLVCVCAATNNFSNKLGILLQNFLCIQRRFLIIKFGIFIYRAQRHLTIFRILFFQLPLCRQKPIKKSLVKFKH